MRLPTDLTEDELRTIVRLVHNAFYWDESRGCWDPDQPVDGGDLVDAIGWLFGEYDMTPADAGEGVA